MLSNRSMPTVTRLVVVTIAATAALAVGPPPVQPAPSASSTNVAQLVGTVQSKARALENSTGMRLSFRSFTLEEISLKKSAIPITPSSVCCMRPHGMPGFWNLHRTVAVQPCPTPIGSGGSGKGQNTFVIDADGVSRLRRALRSLRISRRPRRGQGRWPASGLPRITRLRSGS